MSHLPLIIGLILFLGVHRIPAMPGLRASLHERFGAGGYKGLFSLGSFLGLGLIIWGFGLARQAPVSLYVPPAWLANFTAELMIPVFILLVAYGLPGRIAAFTRHPMLLAIKIWALAHLFSNGLLHEVLLFGGFLVWAILDRISLKKRGVAGATVGARPMVYDGVALFGGLAAYVIFMIWLHPLLIGVPAVY
ncbi:NnrU family protein [Parvularcula sp. IMCC14364]|uniref:NnrU family protein n=1 Tax=Parvularcula sp. IMCC14364 TaxID=3067902 RepID=UPI002740E6CC|nr:NnrU family protein [Parvularcula sp. IMCC14364]